MPKLKCYRIYERRSNSDRWEKKIPASSDTKEGFKTKTKAQKFISTLKHKYGYDADYKIRKGKC